MPRARTPTPEIVDVAPLKRVAAALPSSSVARRIVLTTPDHLGTGAYFERAEAIASAIFAEIEAAKAAESTKKSLNDLAREVVRVAEAA